MRAAKMGVNPGRRVKASGGRVEVERILDAFGEPLRKCLRRGRGIAALEGLLDDSRDVGCVRRLLGGGRQRDESEPKQAEEVAEHRFAVSVERRNDGGVELTMWR